MHNDMSYQEFKPIGSCLYDFNQVSYNSQEDFEHEASEDDKNMYSQTIPCAKKYTEDDIGLRIDSLNRRSFAQKHLFRSASMMLQEDDYSDENLYEAS